MREGRPWDGQGLAGAVMAVAASGWAFAGAPGLATLVGDGARAAATPGRGESPAVGAVGRPKAPAAAPAVQHRPSAAATRVRRSRPVPLRLAGRQQAHLRRGMELLDAGRVDEAVAELEQALQARPDDPTVRFQLARALLAADRPGEALEHAGAALATVPPEQAEPVRFLVAQLHLELDEVEAARAELLALAATRPRFPPVLFTRGELCARMGLLDEAIERFDAAAAGSTDWALVRVRAGQMALDAGRPAEAAERFLAAARQAGSNPNPWLRRGGALLAAGEPAAATEAFEQAVATAPGHVPARVSLALHLVNLREWSRAAAVLEEVLARAPEHRLALLQRARLRSLQGEHAAALADVEAALAAPPAAATPAGPSLDVLGEAAPGDVDPGTTDALERELRTLRVELLAELGRRDEALAAARDLAAVEPATPEALYLLGTLMQRAGDPEARQVLSRFRMIKEAAEQTELGDQFLHDAADLERAAAAYTAALEAWSDARDALVGLAAVRRRQGAAERALELLDRAAGPGKSGAELWRQRFLALDALGRREEALAVWRESRDLGLELGAEVRRSVYRELDGC